MQIPLGYLLDRHGPKKIVSSFLLIAIIGTVAFALAQSFSVSAIWLGVMIGVNLQTSFLTPPFGFALFYLKGVAPKNVTTLNIWKGVMPFMDS